MLSGNIFLQYCFGMQRNYGFGKKHPSYEEKVKVVTAYSNGREVLDLSEIFKFHSMTIYRWIRESKDDRMQPKKSMPGSGRYCKITKKDGRGILKILKKPATNFGFESLLWNTKRIQIVCKNKLDLDISRMAVWRFLNKMD